MRPSRTNAMSLIVMVAPFIRCPGRVTAGETSAAECLTQLAAGVRSAATPIVAAGDVWAQKGRRRAAPRVGLVPDSDRMGIGAELLAFIHGRDRIAREGSCAGA